MTTSGSIRPRVARPSPELGRRPRRRRGWVLLLFAAGAFGLVAWSLAGLGPAGELPEGMLTMSLLVVGATAFLLGAALLGVGLLVLVRRTPVPAAWFVDPEDPHLVRWWDGERWTEHTSGRSAETAALAPLAPTSRRRRAVGAVVLVGGVVVAVGSEALASATVQPATSVDSPGSPVAMLALQLVVPAWVAALVGLYLVLTLSPDVGPGWYPDPQDAAALRWWDGRDWSDATTAA